MSDNKPDNSTAATALDDSAAWGELREGLHIAGYSFERACKRLESLLEHDGWKVGGRFKTVNEFLESLRFDNLKAAAESRTRIARRIKELQPKASNRQIARTLGVDEKTVRLDTAENSALGPKKTSKTNPRFTSPAENSAPGVSGARAAQIVERRHGVAVQERRAERIARIAAISNADAPLPQDRKYPVILADPPWRFEVYDRATGLDLSADAHYPTMSTDDIKALRVPATDDAVLFLWATVPMLEHALDVMRAWNFKYVSGFAWGKDRTGTGHWVLNQHEHLLIGRRGNIPAPPPNARPSSWIDAPRREHSRKPDEAYALIERMYPDLPKIELFARGTRPGWAAWGNQAPAAEPEPTPDADPLTLPASLRRGAP